MCRSPLRAEAAREGAQIRRRALGDNNVDADSDLRRQCKSRTVLGRMHGISYGFENLIDFVCVNQRLTVCTGLRPRDLLTYSRQCTVTVSSDRLASQALKPYRWSTAATSPHPPLQTTMSRPTTITSTGHNPQLRLLNALRAGSKPIMTFLGLPSFRAAQIVAQTGLDVSSALSDP